MNITNLTGLPAIQTRGDADTWPEYRAVIEQAITDHPRSQQTRIGPSEIGIPCDRCLARKLAGIPEPRDAAWLPTLGTAVHAWLADLFTEANRDLQVARYLVEMRVSVGEIDSVDITGSCDLHDRETGDVTDWKIVGKSALEKAKAGHIKPEYRVQAHGYGRGWIRRGLPVRNVQVVFLPRNEHSLATAHVWSEPYDEQIVIDALSHADALAKAIRLVGPDTVIPTLSNDPDCYSCRRYDPTNAPGPRDPLKQLTGLLISDANTVGTTAA